MAVSKCASRISKTSERVLVVVAHPDDEVLGCGATIARLVASGAQLHVLILGGVTTSREDAARGTIDEAASAAKAMGVASLNRCDLPDNRFDSLPLLQLVKEVERFKKKICPTLIFTHDHTDLNIDHRLTHQAVLTAFRPDVDTPYFRILTFETLSSTEFQDQGLSSFKPTLYVDIDDFIEIKIKAMKCYRSELRRYPHPRSLEGIRIQAQKRGLEVCLRYAEAFRTVREVI